MQVALVLLQKRADPFRLDKKGFNCLHHAAMSGHTAVTEILLQDVKFMSKRVIQHYNPLELLESRDPNGMTALHWAVYQGHIQTVQSLLAKYPQLAHSEDLNGNTPFHCACERGNERIAIMLAESGAVLFQRKLRTPDLSLIYTICRYERWHDTVALRSDVRQCKYCKIFSGKWCICKLFKQRQVSSIHFVSCFDN